MSNLPGKQLSKKSTEASQVAAKTSQQQQSLLASHNNQASSNGGGGSSIKSNNVSVSANNAGKYPASNTAKSYSSADINKIVLEYLSHKGFHRTEAMLRKESVNFPLGSKQQNVFAEPISAANTSVPGINPVILKLKDDLLTEDKVKQVLMFDMYQESPLLTSNNNRPILSETSNKNSTISANASLYLNGYSILRDWVHSSLDFYKPELMKVLYPIFMHCYIDLIEQNELPLAKQLFNQYMQDHIYSFKDEVIKLSAISSMDQLHESDFVTKYRDDEKYKIKISSIPVYLLLFFLTENRYVGGDLIIRIINQFLEFEISPDKLFSNLNNDYKSAAANENNNTAFNDTDAENFNIKKIKMGKFPRDDEFDQEVEHELKLKDEKETLKRKLHGSTSSKPSLVGEFNKIKAEKTNPTATESSAISNIGTEESTEIDRNDQEQTKKEQEKDLNDSVFKEGTIYDKLKLNDTNFDSPEKDSLPLPSKSYFDLKREIQIVQDSRSTLKLSFDKNQFSPPSICMYTFHNSLDEITCLEFNENNNIVAAGFEDSYIKLWSIDGNPLKSVNKSDSANKLNTRKLVGHSGTVYNLCFSPDNRYLISCSEDGTVRLWSLDTFTTLVVYKSHNSPIWDVKFSPFGHYFVTASNDNTARLWSVDHIYPLKMFVGHISDVDCAVWAPNGCYVFTGSTDNTVRMWDVTNGECVRLFIGHSSAINCLLVCPNGRILASSGEDSVINIWDISSGKILKTMRGHAAKGSIYSLDFSRDGNILVSGGSDKSVRVWDVKKNSDNPLSEPVPFKTNDDKSKTNISEDIKEKSKTTSITAVDKNKESDTKDASSKCSEKPKKAKEVLSTKDQVGVYFTKLTSVYKVHFTRRNLCLVAGIFSSVAHNA